MEHYPCREMVVGVFSPPATSSDSSEWAADALCSSLYNLTPWLWGSDGQPGEFGQKKEKQEWAEFGH